MTLLSQQECKSLLLDIVSFLDPLNTIVRKREGLYYMILKPTIQMLK